MAGKVRCREDAVADSAGWYLPPKGYLKRLREICDKHGILLIFDEVITGFGRLGAWFGSERYDITISGGASNVRGGDGARRPQIRCRPCSGAR